MHNVDFTDFTKSLWISPICGWRLLVPFHLLVKMTWLFLQPKHPWCNTDWLRLPRPGISCLTTCNMSSFIFLPSIYSFCSLAVDNDCTTITHPSIRYINSSLQEIEETYIAKICLSCLWKHLKGILFHHSFLLSGCASLSLFKIRYVYLSYYNNSDVKISLLNRLVLCDQRVVNLTHSRTIFWGCSINSPEGYRG